MVLCVPAMILAFFRQKWLGGMFGRDAIPVLLMRRKGWPRHDGLSAGGTAMVCQNEVVDLEHGNCT
jgi:hypothetical protein